MVAVVVAAWLGAVPALAGDRGPAILSSAGIAGVRFGLSQREAVAGLRRVFGAPSRPFLNAGCGSRYREVAWGHLYVEFRDGTFSGFRYQTARWLPQHAQKSARPSRVRPKLRTARGVTLGSTLGRVRASYGRLNPIGTDRWQTGDGLVFYDSATREPPPASSPIVEIKYGTCGDF